MPGRRASIVSLESLQSLVTVALALCVVWFVAVTIHWPLFGDAELMHYVVFLMDHGLAPYRDIGDMNLPGAYVPDWLIVHTLGGSGLAWRCYDLGLLLAGGVAMTLLVRPAAPLRFPHAGFWAAALFILIHGRDGVTASGERDLTAAVILLLGTAALVRIRVSARICLVFGLSIGAAATIKPTALPFLLVAAPVLWQTRRAGILSGYIALGSAIPPGISLAWLAHLHAVGAFLTTMRILTPFHASLGRQNLPYLLQHSFSPVMPVATIWLLLFGYSRFIRSSAKDPDRRWMALLVAAAMGLLSYLLQMKAYPYQRYPFLAFLLTLIATDLSRWSQRRGALRCISIALIAISTAAIAIPSTLAIGRLDWRHYEFESTLQGDLETLSTRLGPLSGRVQCLDTIAGCIQTLNHIQLMQSSGFLYDEFLFHRAGVPAVDESRGAFWRAIQADPPAVFVVSAPLFPAVTGNYEKLTQWPEFAQWLDKNYVMARERPTMRRFRNGGAAYSPPGYRIYVRRDLALTSPSR